MSLWATALVGAAVGFAAAWIIGAWRSRRNRVLRVSSSGVYAGSIVGMDQDGRVGPITGPNAVVLGVAQDPGDPGDMVDVRIGEQ